MGTDKSKKNPKEDIIVDATFEEMMRISVMPIKKKALSPSKEKKPKKVLRLWTKKKSE